MGKKSETRWTAARAEDVLEEWRKSGQSAATFARSMGVSVERLFWWRNRLATRKPRVSAVVPTLVPVVVRGEGTAQRPVVVVTRAGDRIEITDVNASTAAWVAAVLADRGWP